MLSHGNGGTPSSHRALAVHLVASGFAVLMVEHPGNNRKDNGLGGPSGRVQPILLQHRPRHVRLAFDSALADALEGSLLVRDSFAMVGESIGAYTALAVAGGQAMAMPNDVDEASLLAPDEEVARLAFSVPTERDVRLRAAVLLVPAASFFLADGSLADVIPLLVRTGARDPIWSRGLNLGPPSAPAATIVGRQAPWTFSIEPASVARSRASRMAAPHLAGAAMRRRPHLPSRSRQRPRTSAPVDPTIPPPEAPRSAGASAVSQRYPTHTATPLMRSLVDP